MHIVNRVKRFREQLNLSQTALAAKVMLAQANLSDIELGKRYPGKRVLVDLCRVLGATVLELYPESTGLDNGLVKVGEVYLNPDRYQEALTWYKKYGAEWEEQHNIKVNTRRLSALAHRVKPSEPEVTTELILRGKCRKYLGERYNHQLSPTTGVYVEDWSAWMELENEEHI